MAVDVTHIRRDEAVLNLEGVDREFFAKLVKENPNTGVILVQNNYELINEYTKNLRGLFQLKLSGRCGTKCSWLIWRDKPQHCWWIQHNLNPEHVHKMVDIPNPFRDEVNTDLGYYMGEIGLWIGIVHQEEEAYLEEISDSFRTTVRKRHERSNQSSTEDRDGLLGFRDDPSPSMEGEGCRWELVTPKSGFRSTQKQDGGFYLSYGREDVGFSGMAHMDFKPLRFG